MLRTVALAIAAIAMVVFVGGCGTDSTKADLAAQDKAVQLGNQLAAIHRRVAQAQRLVAQRRRQSARLQTYRAARPAPPRIQVVRSAGFSLDSLCAPVRPRGNARLARQLRKQRERARRQALYQLNLSCPPSGS